MKNTQVPILYADGIGKIRLENGVVKIDLVTLDDHYVNPGSAPQKAQNVSTSLVLSIQGFRQSLATMQEMEQSMETSKKPRTKEAVNQA